MSHSNPTNKGYTCSSTPILINKVLATSTTGSTVIKFDQSTMANSANAVGLIAINC